MGNPMLDSALHYARMGLSVIPLHGKRPFFDNWPMIATCDEAVISKWWNQEPKANIGIATGRKSNIFVVDVDPKNGGEESIDTLFSRHGRFPDTWTDITGSGGTHYYFRYPAFAIGNAAGLMPGIDIRGDGGQVVAPPSIHPETGKRYIWDGLDEPDREPPAEAPLWLLEMLQPKEKKQSFSVDARIPHGVQHTTLVSLAGCLRKLGLSEDEMLPTLLRVNAGRCERPGPERNIQQIAHSMMRYQPADKSLWAQAATLWRLTRQAEAAAKETQDRLAPIDGYTLMRKEMAGIRMVIDGCLHNGCTILAGAPKAGKSWLTLGMALAVATGGKFISACDVTSPGRVAYFGLEEHERRTRDRLERLVPEASEALRAIEFMYELRPMFSGGLDDLRSYLAQACPTLVIIDTLMAFVTGDRGSRRDVFRDDYREIKALSDLAQDTGTALVVVHHTSKMGGKGVNAVAGTHGVTAAADCIWTMQRQPDRKALLDITGREVEDQSFLMALELREPIGWYALEQGDDAALSGERQEILDLIREEGTMKPSKMAMMLRKNSSTVRNLVMRLAERGLIVKQSDGTYRLVRGDVE